MTRTTYANGNHAPQATDTVAITYEHAGRRVTKTLPVHEVIEDQHNGNIGAGRGRFFVELRGSNEFLHIVSPEGGTMSATYTRNGRPRIYRDVMVKVVPAAAPERTKTDALADAAPALLAALEEVTARFGEALDFAADRHAMGFGKENATSWRAAREVIEKMATIVR